MGRALRTDVGGQVYHVLNRANARLPLFRKKADYELFEKVLEEAKEKIGMRILSYCIMPNHWHLVLYPQHDGELSKFVNWLTLTHTQRWHASHRTIGYGHLYQGRYKSFLCEKDEHFVQLVRYVERNPLRANLVRQAEDWRWGSAWRRQRGTPRQRTLLDEWPVSMPRAYSKLLNEPQSEAEVAAMRRSVTRGNPFGSDVWTGNVIKKYDLEITIRPRGRPRKGS
ncbi:MAG: putative transposase [Parcubacteria group bacterium Gr01-1014_56]|nr:MAG: putative transposase [Parcubacteria group bacterium Gr01-1014_56]